MRPDRFLTIHLFHPFRKRLVHALGNRVPILMYHSISDAPEDGRHPYYRTNTSPRVFKQQMRYLQTNSYSVIPLKEAVEFMHGGDRPPKSKAVVITFDDGFGDFHTDAYPVLQEYGFSAIVFLPTGFISDVGTKFMGKRCLRWGEIRKLAASGIQFGTHTVTHPRLRDLDWEQIEREIQDSKKVLEDKIGSRVESFSYPYAFPEEDDRLKSKLKSLLVESGYKNGVTTKIGTATKNDDRLFHSRIPVNTEDDPVFFRSKLDGGYDWMHILQYGSKILNRRLK